MSGSSDLHPSMAVVLLKLAGLCFFAWIAVRTTWLEWTLAARADGTPLYGLVVFLIWPLSALVLFAAVRDARRIARRERGGAVWLAAALEVIGILSTALGALHMFLVKGN